MIDGTIAVVIDRMMRSGVAVLLVLVGCAAPTPPADAWPPFDAAATPDAPAYGDAGSDAFAAADSPSAMPDAQMHGGSDAPLPTCSLVGGTDGGCDSIHACRLGTGGAYCGSINAQPGEYGACSFDSDCAPGQQCLSVGGESFCRVWCDSTTTCDQSRGVRSCIHPDALFNADTSVELHPPAGVGICGAA